MRIAFCTPFKPVNHPSVSGDVTIARDLMDGLRGLGHDVVQLKYFPAKEIHWKPSLWPGAGLALKAMMRQAEGADCWLTYGTYYKVPDVFGPIATRRLNLPYFIFQASYAVNRAKKIATWPGYMLNKRAMLRAAHVFCNRMNDVRGCARLLPEDRYTYIRPGIPGSLFGRDDAARKRLRADWGVQDRPVVVTAAMMRHGVKARGLEWVFATCADLLAKGRDFHLVVAGGGPRRKEMEALAAEKLGDRVTFLGMVERGDLAAVFSAGDLFAFPGLEESVGMVYLEAQRCGLPVVATDDEGAPYVVEHGRSGLVTSVSQEEFTGAVDTLLRDEALRRRLGEQARVHVAEHHLVETNYRKMARLMEGMAVPGKNR